MADRRFVTDPETGFLYEERCFTDDTEGGDGAKMNQVMGDAPGYVVEARWNNDVLGRRWLRTGKFPVQQGTPHAIPAPSKANGDLENRTIQQLKTTAAMEGCDKKYQQALDKGTLVAAIQERRASKKPQTASL